MTSVRVTFLTPFISVPGSRGERPCALYVHGNSDTTSAVRAVESIATGLRWKRLRDPVTVIDELDAADAADMRRCETGDPEIWCGGPVPGRYCQEAVRGAITSTTWRAASGRSS